MSTIDTKSKLYVSSIKSAISSQASHSNYIFSFTVNNDDKELGDPGTLETNHFATERE